MYWEEQITLQKEALSSAPIFEHALSLRVKRQGREADHSLPSSAEVKE
jgi:hypothetical protein